MIKMFTEERHNIILRELKIKGMISVNDLVKLLNTSESTIRRDLNALDSEGLLKKIHGGATLVGEKASRHDYKVNVRKSLNLDEKRKIAIHAASLIQDEDVIYIDAGTTTELIIEFISNTNITAVTNGIVHAKKLLEIKDVTEAIIGSNAVLDLKKYNFSKGFFGANGISNENGYTTPDVTEGMVKAEALRRCKKAYVLADESKLDQVSFVTFGNIEDATLITNKLNGNTKYDTNVIGVI